jgi:selenocysteine-specific elongation factor
MTSGDRFILRDVGRKMVIAGGRVLDPAPGKLGPALSHGRDLDPGEGIDGIATALLRIRGEERARIIANHSGGGTPRDGQLVGEVWVTSTRLEELSNRALQLVAEEHQQHPLREGLPMATLSERLGVEAALTEAAVDAHPRLARRGAFAVEESHEVAMTPQQIEAWAEAREKIGRGLDVPRLDDLGIDDELVHLLFRRGELVRIAEDLALLPSQVEQVKDVIAAMPEGFKVAEFRDRAGLSRKYAVPLLEWADKEGLTIRRGDTRTAR